MRFSNPQQLSPDSATVSLNLPPLITLREQCDISDKLCRKACLPLGDRGNILLECVCDLSREMTYIEQSRAVTDEKYVITTSLCGETLHISVRFSGERSLYYALCELKRQCEQNCFYTGVIEDYPLFSRRGWIEGFYGKPWSFDERVQMLHLLSAHRMNTYFFAPKDDEYHRKKWDSLYPAQELSRLAEIKRVADECYVDFWFCISPGLSIRYSDLSQLASLKNKLMQLRSVGITRFGLLLDDIPPQLTDAEDIRRFGSETVRAHIYLANALYDELKAEDSSIELTLCPMQYHGIGDEYYISMLGKNIEPDINLFWTGRNICSQELTVREAVLFENSTRHKPLYWDNFPVNDAEMCNEMHLGYICGREPELYRYSAGLISNCMEFCECSKIPLLTIADYLWNPVCYEPERSWSYALHAVAGDNADRLLPLADNLLTSCLKADNSPLLCEALCECRSALLQGNAEKALEIFSGYIEKADDCCELLCTHGGEKLYSELQRWSEKYKVCTELLKLCLCCLKAPSPEIKAQTAAKLEQYMKMPETLADFCLRETAEYILNM